jgi:hypothetical protein
VHFDVKSRSVPRGTNKTAAEILEFVYEMRHYQNVPTGTLRRFEPLYYASCDVGKISRSPENRLLRVDVWSLPEEAILSGPLALILFAAKVQARNVPWGTFLWKP